MKRPREAVWSGFLPEGGTQSFHAPFGEAVYAVKKNPEDPWEEDRAACMNGEAVQIP